MCLICVWGIVETLGSAVARETWCLVTAFYTAMLPSFDLDKIIYHDLEQSIRAADAVGDLRWCCANKGQT